MIYYKVLVDGKSCHGGSMEWALPAAKQPGQWMSVDGDISICQRGIHLTTDPTQWLKVGCEIFEAEAGEIHGSDKDKIVTNKARLLQRVDAPEWWTRTEEFIATIPSVPFCKPDGKPNKKWKLFTAPTLAAARAAARDATLAAARDAARDAAWAAAWAAAWDAAGDAAFKARLELVSDLKLAKKHRDHINARWEVWRKGYCLLCDVNGVLYVYAQEAKP